MTDRLPVPKVRDLQLQKNFDALTKRIENPPRCRVYSDTNVSIANNDTTQVVTFNQERYDPHGMHDVSTNNSRITFPADGTYAVGGNFQFAANATGRRQLGIRLNGTTLLAVEEYSGAVSATVPCNMGIYTEYEFAAGDYVEIRAFQTSGGALNVSAVGNFSPEFFAHRIGGSVA